MSQPKLWCTLVLDEILSCGVVGVWGMRRVAVVQNNHKALMLLVQRDTDVQRGAHWQGDLACWVNLTVIRGAVQEHGGFCSGPLA